MNSYIRKPQRISRRCFVGKSFIAMAGISLFNSYACVGNSKNNKILRIIAYNVLKCTGWPVDNVSDKENVPILIAQELAKYDPDIINFSESPDESIVEIIAKQLNMNYVRFPSAGNWPGTILTKFSITESANVPIVSGNRPEDLFTRHWGKAKIQMTGEESIIIHSAHLFPHDTPEAGAIRKREISEILHAMQIDKASGKSIILMGDLNHTPEMPEYSQWMEADLIDTFIKAGKGDGLTVVADNPKRRIDYIMAYGPLSKSIKESRALFEGKFRTNPSDSKSFALSDHIPQFAEFGLDI